MKLTLAQSKQMLLKGYPIVAAGSVRRFPVTVQSNENMRSTEIHSSAWTSLVSSGFVKPTSSLGLGWSQWTKA